MRKMITSLSQLDFDKHYTISDYLQWKLEERVELIKGRLFKMAPAPNIDHQRVSKNIIGDINAILKGHDCEYFFAPVDVFFDKYNEKGEQLDDTVVQPDIIVVCDDKKLEKDGCHGAPDIVVEILSPSTTKKDMSYKYELYEEQGVKEYWVVYPRDGAVTIYRLKDGEYWEDGPYKRIGDMLKSDAVDGLEILLDDIFEEVDDGNVTLEPKLEYSREVKRR